MNFALCDFEHYSTAVGSCNAAMFTFEIMSYDLLAVLWYFIVLALYDWQLHIIITIIYHYHKYHIIFKYTVWGILHSKEWNTIPSKLSKKKKKKKEFLDFQQKENKTFKLFTPENWLQIG